MKRILFALLLTGCGNEQQIADLMATPTPTAIPSEKVVTKAEQTIVVTASPNVESLPSAMVSSAKQNYSFALKSKSLLPECESSVLNQLVYIIDEDLFYVCQSDTTWKSIEIKGKDGVKGDQGIAGKDGQSIVGPKGDKGDQGIQGIAGVKGDTGVQGIKGDTGNQGIQGAKGDTGDQGIQGIQGLAGTNGTNGANGSTGSTGDSYGLTTSAATVGNCPAGGTTIGIFKDLNHNGTYDSGSETITNSTNVCNGLQGAQGVAGTNGTNATLTVATQATCFAYFNWTSTTHVGGFTDIYFAEAFKVVTNYTKFSNGVVSVDVSVRPASLQGGLWEVTNTFVYGPSAPLYQSVWFNPLVSPVHNTTTAFTASFDLNPNTSRACDTNGNLCHEDQGYLQVIGKYDSAKGISLTVKEHDQDVGNNTIYTIPNVEESCNIKASILGL